MRERGCTACAMEVSSHALALHRVDGVRLRRRGLHQPLAGPPGLPSRLRGLLRGQGLALHPERSRHGVVCVDDDWGRRLAAPGRDPGDDAASAARMPLPGNRTRRSTGAVERSAPDRRRCGHRLRPGRPGTGDGWSCAAPCRDRFNVANTALAALMLLQAGLPAPDIAPRDRRGRAVSPAGWSGSTGPPGTPLAIVDYAHTPEAVTAALAALRPATRGRLVVVLGAGGDRDQDKRAPMGAAAARAADVVIVTDDNPRSEDPPAIRAAVLAGARAAARRTPSWSRWPTAGKPYVRPWTMPDRRATPCCWPARATSGARRWPAWSRPSSTVTCWPTPWIEPGSPR